MPTNNQRADDAANPGASALALRELAADGSRKVRAAVAANPSTPADLLETLAADTAWEVRFAVAENPDPAAAAIALRAPDADTRGIAAQRRDLDADGVRTVLADPEHSVRERLAQVSTDLEVLTALAHDAHPAVRAAVLQNPHLPPEGVELLAADPAAQVRAAAAASRRAQPETVLRLARDRSSKVRWWVLVAHPDRVDVATLLLDDPDPRIAEQARNHVDSPHGFPRGGDGLSDELAGIYPEELLEEVLRALDAHPLGSDGGAVQR